MLSRKIARQTLSVGGSGLFLLFLACRGAFAVEYDSAGMSLNPVSNDAKSNLVVASDDIDGDGLTNERELTFYFTDPNNSDTDGDGYDDATELKNGYSPRHGAGQKLLLLDSDGDDMNDGWELAQGTGIMDSDTDDDGYTDGEEVMNGHNPRSSTRDLLEKLIEVDLSEARLRYSLGGRTLEEFLISPGKASTPTPKGEYSVLQKVPVKRYVGVGYDYPNTKWNLHFTTGRARYYIHGAYWHSRWGQGASSGCVNVSYDRMERLYDWAEVGTKIVIRQ